MVNERAPGSLVPGEEKEGLAVGKFEGPVPESVADTFSDGIDDLARKGSDADEADHYVGSRLDKKTQDRLALLDEEFRGGKSVKEVLSAATDDGDDQRVADVQEYGKIITEYTRSVGKREGKLTSEQQEALQVGAAMGRAASVQEVLMHDEAWLRGQQQQEPDYYRRMSQRMVVANRQTDLPEHYRRLAGQAYAKLQEVQKPLSRLGYKKPAVEGEIVVDSPDAHVEEPIDVEYTVKDAGYNAPPRLTREGSKRLAVAVEEDIVEEESGLDVTLERNVDARLFGQESPVQADDVQAAQARVVELTSEDSVKNAFETAKLLANLKRAKITMTGGQEKVSTYLQKQRQAMMDKGPRALAQYLTYCKYIGAVKEVSDVEQKSIMAGIHERVQKDPEHKGLSALAMNARYLGVEGYDAKIVGGAVYEEQQALRRSGDVDAVVKSVARAKLAGLRSAVSQNENVIDKAIGDRLQQHKTEGRWDRYAKLRKDLNIAQRWQQMSIGERGQMVAYAGEAKRQGPEVFASYLADASELSRQSETDRGNVQDVAVQVSDAAKGSVDLSEEEYREYFGDGEESRVETGDIPNVESISAEDRAEFEKATRRRAKREEEEVLSFMREQKNRGGLLQRAWRRLTGRGRRAA